MRARVIIASATAAKITNPLKTASGHPKRMARAVKTTKEKSFRIIVVYLACAFANHPRHVIGEEGNHQRKTNGCPYHVET